MVTPIVETTYLIIDMCKFKSSKKMKAEHNRLIPPKVYRKPFNFHHISSGKSKCWYGTVPKEHGTNFKTTFPSHGTNGNSFPMGKLPDTSLFSGTQTYTT